MSGEDIRIDSADIRSAMPKFVTEAERLRAAADAFKAMAAGLGEPWGDDENGRKFGATFAANQTVIIQGADVLAQGVASIAPALEAMVSNTLDTDDANAKRLS
ncbi:hypothetical protein [Embleya sp. AB8]|uniref:hypothetical protein n=1 Tax=Embleya sp. AB8 TaxID=3156304 RepID=UPI003C77F1A9